MRPLVRLFSMLLVDECKARLSKNVDLERFSLLPGGYAGSRDILGSMRDNTFRLQHRRYYHNSFAPYFYGRFVASDGGTLIEGDFKMHLSAKIAFTVWVLVFSAMAVLLLSSFLEGATSALPISLVCGALAVAAIANVKFGKWLSRREQPAIIGFLKVTFEAKTV
jgi:hypothetical protein